MTDETKKTLMAVGVGVGATGVIATAMYFLGGRESPKMPSLGDVTWFTKREIGLGALHAYDVDDRVVYPDDTGRIVGFERARGEEFAIIKPDHGPHGLLTRVPLKRISPA
jgi:hypothetical protein